jgi:hypothetical protein
MQLVVQDGRVIATHGNDQNFDGGLREKYPGCDVVSYDGNFTLEPNPENNLDPRTAEQKLLAYRDQRRLAYPPIGDQLDMIYWDQINETTIWQDTVAAVKILYPKPE